MNLQLNDLFVSQTDSSMPGQSGCLTVNVLSDCVFKRESCGGFSLSSVVFFLQSSFQQSTAQSTCNHPIILTLTDHHCQLWLKKKASIITLCHHTMFPSPPSAGMIAAHQRPKSNSLVKSLDAWMAAWVNECCFELLRFIGSVPRFGALPLSYHGLRSTTMIDFLASRG